MRGPLRTCRALQRTPRSSIHSSFDAVASTPSLRTAASVLLVHHSTLQERVAAAERVLGWDIRDPQGRLRLQLALVVRRLLAS